MTKPEMISKIKNFAKLNKDWDSYGGVPPNKVTRGLAIDMIDCLPSERDWFVAPISGGEIVFEDDEATIIVYSD